MMITFCINCILGIFQGTPMCVFRAKAFGTDADLLYTWRSTLCKGSISVHDRPDLEAHINLHKVHMSKEQQRVNIMCVHLLPELCFFWEHLKLDSVRLM